MPRYSMQIHAIFVAPEHRIFGQADKDLSGGDLASLPEADLIEHAGIEGDRFCRPRPDYDGHVTFFSLEVWQAVAKQLNLPGDASPALARRNIIVSGIDLKALYGIAFSIQNIHFLGTVHCAPCVAMNRAIGPGARAALRGRGGLRSQVKSSGRLDLGHCELVTEAAFNPRSAAHQSREPRIP